MRLSETALREINNKVTRRKIAQALNIGEAAVMLAIKKNTDTLTKFAAIQVIKEETGLSESEILEPQNA